MYMNEDSKISKLAKWYKSCTLEKYSENNGSIPVKNWEIAKLINLWIVEIILKAETGNAFW